MVGNDSNVEPPTASEDNVNYDATNMPSNWLVNDTNTSNTSSGVITVGTSMVEVSSCPSGPMLDSFCPPKWDQSTNVQNLGYYNMNVQNGPVRASMGWMPTAMLRDSTFLPTFSPIPHSMPPFPADSAFIERAVRLSCFNGGNFSEIVSPFNVFEPHTPAIEPIQGPNKVVTGDGSERSPRNVTEVSREASLLGKNEKESESFVQVHNETKSGVNVSGNQGDESEFSGGGGESSGKGRGLKKRKRTEQKTENDEAPQPDEDTTKDKSDQNRSSTSNLGGKHGKQESQVSDPPKEEYIHVRARRGQATNSHSLAERIRREKISERMKFLQDLVPGCSKVTGKAVMLDEIINYVQSLQRQVEFLSMKLATVNPQLDYDMEGFLAKYIVQSGGVLSSSVAFPPDIALPFPLLHQPQPVRNQAGLPGLRNSSETLQRSIGLVSTDVCGGLGQPTSQHMQAPSVWEDELHNVVHNSYNSTAPLNTQDLSGHES